MSAWAEALPSVAMMPSLDMKRDVIKLIATLCYTKEEFKNYVNHFHAY